MNKKTITNLVIVGLVIMAGVVTVRLLQGKDKNDKKKKNGDNAKMSDGVLAREEKEKTEEKTEEETAEVAGGKDKPVDNGDDGVAFLTKTASERKADIESQNRKKKEIQALIDSKIKILKSIPNEKKHRDKVVNLKNEIALLKYQLTVV